MRFLVLGGTGFIGRHLIGSLVNMNHKVTAIIRSFERGNGLPQVVDLVLADPLEPGDWQRYVEWADAIVNLVGRPIVGPWTATVKREILETRLKSTKVIVNALAKYGTNRTTLINASAIGYYGADCGESEISEKSENGKGFLANVTREWERCAWEAANLGHRVVLTRIGIVLGNGGMLEKILPAFKYGLGARLGTGRQWMSWIHICDIVSALIFIAETEHIQGPVNLTAPHPCKNAEFTRVLASIMGRPAILRIPAQVLKLVLREASELILSNQKVVPDVLLESKFRFLFPTIESCLLDLLKNKRSCFS